MILSISRSRQSLWGWLFWALGIYLALELGSFFIAALLLKTTVTELLGPYLAIAAPWIVFAPIIWWLRKREEQRASPTRLARIWGLSMAFFGVAEIAAIVYSGAVLRFITLTADLIASLLVLLLSVPILYFVMYYQALRVISTRVAMGPGGDRPK
jgi:hypothetical protein